MTTQHTQPLPWTNSRSSSSPKGANEKQTVLRPGQTVDNRYRAERLIAEGGMAEVWAGRATRLGKTVAMKVIRRSFADRTYAQEMLRRESLAASKINHPNVLSVFDVVEHNGMTCIVMEFLQGESLAEYLFRHGPLSVDEAARFLLPAMRGVAAAHAQGIVHRDLKPANIFLCKDNDGSVLATKVLDFGISKVMESQPTSDSNLTDLAHFGTPAYMAPEDLMGAANVDFRADIYAFGTLLFEALTGKRPFPGEPDMALINTILNERPPRLRSLRPELPIEIDAVIDRALAKAPQDRFSSMGQLIRAVESHFSAPAAAVAAPPAPRRTAQRHTVRLRRRRALHWHLGMAATVIAAALCWGWMSFARSPAKSLHKETPPVPVAEQEAPSSATVTDERPVPAPTVAELEKPLADPVPSESVHRSYRKGSRSGRSTNRHYSNPFSDSPQSLSSVVKQRGR